MTHIEAITSVCQAIHDGMEHHGISNTWAKRLAVAHTFGSMDAKHMVYMLQTYGYPLGEYIRQCRKLAGESLSIPWNMLEHELLCIGKDQGSIHSLFRELRLEAA